MCGEKKTEDVAGNRENWPLLASSPPPTFSALHPNSHALSRCRVYSPLQAASPLLPSIHEV
eukprot:scaffold4309_cov252-Alexandrium_tamarense.AAC.13